jgi:putative membrane protein
MIRKASVCVRTGAWLALAVAPLCVLGCQDQGRSDSTPNAIATPNDKSGQPSAAKLDDATKTNILLRQLHAANQEEIDLGKLANDKAVNADVRKFANDMVTDHTAADQNLTDLAKRMNIDINTSPVDPVQKALSAATDQCKRSLRGQSGSEFDVAYFAPQVEKHNLALKLVEEAQKTASGDVKKLLDDMHPTVESHLDHAKTVMRGLTFSAAVGGGPLGHEMAPTGNAPGSRVHEPGGVPDNTPKTGIKGTPKNP